MKNKIISLFAGVAFIGTIANADIAIGEDLTAFGYIDQVVTDLEGGDNREGSLGEYEIGLRFTPAESQFSAVAELSYDHATSGAEFETVAVSYQHNEALSFHIGRLYTFQGLESDDAPENDFISYAGRDIDNDGSADDLYGANYAHGIAAVYNVGDINIAAWSQADSNPIKQYAASYSGIDNLTLGVAIIDYNDNTESTNFHAVYELGDFTISAENVDSDNAAKTLDVTSVSVAYNLGDTTIAVRSVDGDYNNGNDYEKVSVAAFHALSDNVSVGVEYSDEDDNGTDSSGYGVELLYVF